MQVEKSGVSFVAPCGYQPDGADLFSHNNTHTAQPQHQMARSAMHAKPPKESAARIRLESIEVSAEWVSSCAWWVARGGALAVGAR